MGLMALHLLLLSFNKVKPSLQGSVHIYSDCLGALNKVEHLPPQRIPSKCRHSDVLKNIMVNCTSLSFKRFFSHVQAHQDDKYDFSNLERPSQLNCICDGEVKLSIIQTDLLNLPHQRAFPLEPITLFVDNQKVTTESGPVIRFAAQRQEARAVFAERGVLFFGEQFDEVAWRHVYSTLHHVPKMFQIFICKQVFDISATFHFYNKRMRLYAQCARLARLPGRLQATSSAVTKVLYACDAVDGLCRHKQGSYFSRWEIYQRQGASYDGRDMR